MFTVFSALRATCVTIAGEEKKVSMVNETVCFEFLKLHPWRPRGETTAVDGR